MLFAHLKDENEKVKTLMRELFIPMKQIKIVQHLFSSFLSFCNIFLSVSFLMFPSWMSLHVKDKFYVTGSLNCYILI